MDDDNLRNGTLPVKERKGSYKAIVLGLLLAIFVLQVVYTVSQRRGNPGRATDSLLSVDIAASPQGAEIFLDGKRAGVSNAHLEVASGAHELMVLLPGYESRKETITLTQPQTIRVDLEPMPLELRIQTGERRADIWLDDEAQESVEGQTFLRGIRPGMHTIRIKAASELATISFDLQAGSPPVPALIKSRPTILFIAGFLGKVRSECNCTAQLQVNGVSQSLEPGAGAESELPEGEYSAELKAQGSAKTIAFEMGARPTATLAVFWPAKSVPKPSPPDTQSLLSTALSQIGSSKCDAAELTIAQILRTERENADAVGLQRRIARLRSVGGCQ